MALDTLDSELAKDVAVFVTRDGAGRPRAFLEFVPTYGRAALSLSSMRRDPATPNGTTEFLVARALETLRERGAVEVSLNFAAFGRLLRAPVGRLDRLLRLVIGAADRFFQIESLYRFNAKFQPEWYPRYLVYDRALALPRIALATLWAEGQLAVPLVARPADSIRGR